MNAVLEKYTIAYN